MMTMNKAIALALGALLMGSGQMNAQTMIQKNNIQLTSDLMTPEALWAMGRIGSAQASPDGKQVVYQVSYYSVKQNASHTMMVTKYGVADDIAGTIVAIVPFGAILLTPIFGHLYDRLRRGTAFILAGATLFTAVHLLFALPIHLGPCFWGT